MDKRKFIFWGAVLLIGLMLTGCAGFYGPSEYDNPYSGYGYRGSPYREYRGGW